MAMDDYYGGSYFPAAQFIGDEPSNRGRNRTRKDYGTASNPRLNTDLAVRGGALAQGYSNQELLRDPRTNYLGNVGLMRGGVYSPTTFDPNYRPEISPRSGQGLLTPMTGGIPRFPGSYFGGGTMLTDYRNLDTSSVLGGIQNRFGYSPQSNIPTASLFGLGMNDQAWQRQYGFGY